MQEKEMTRTYDLVTEVTKKDGKVLFRQFSENIKVPLKDLDELFDGILERTQKSVESDSATVRVETATVNAFASSNPFIKDLLETVGENIIYQRCLKTFLEHYIKMLDSKEKLIQSKNTLSKYKNMHDEIIKLSDSVSKDGEIIRSAESISEPIK